MNTMALLTDGFQKVEVFCTEHNIAKVQAGPNQICPKCAINLVEFQNKNRQKEIDQMVREKHFAGAMLPERHAESGFKNYTVQHAGQKNSLNQSISYAKNILIGVKNNFVMVGKTGVGKTHLSCATARTLLNKGMYVRYITSEEMAQKIMRAWDKDTKDASERSVIYEFTQYDLLILDEYGLHDRDKRLELVHKVLYARYDAMKPTMLISNFTLAELQKDLGDRLWSRFQQGGLTVVECNWADQRLGQVGGGV
ncbi:ATP-binding protein [Acinetobacter terrestris]|uniref:ATP-binding protein n=1 Tax=Acinetobacter terrestris TaxID=2529843 RepID=A0ABX1UR07_9GAMM|nr:ATP-binding protein [Acinetobacter terrestris]NNH25648.1 ATP-binding protein [Acinetobacter terrestris]